MDIDGLQKEDKWRVTKWREIEEEQTQNLSELLVVEGSLLNNLTFNAISMICQFPS